MKIPKVAFPWSNSPSQSNANDNTACCIEYSTCKYTEVWNHYIRL